MLKNLLDGLFLRRAREGRMRRGAARTADLNMVGEGTLKRVFYNVADGTKEKWREHIGWGSDIEVFCHRQLFPGFRGGGSSELRSRGITSGFRDVWTKKIRAVCLYPILSKS